MVFRFLHDGQIYPIRFIDEMEDNERIVLESLGGESIQLYVYNGKLCARRGKGGNKIYIDALPDDHDDVKWISPKYVNPDNDYSDLRCLIALKFDLDVAYLHRKENANSPVSFVYGDEMCSFDVDLELGWFKVTRSHD